MAVSNLKTAPSFLLLSRGDNPHTVKWSIKDRILFSAVSALESMKCPHCGVPAWHGQTADGRVEFETTWSVCYGCQAKDEAEKEAGDDRKVGEWVMVKATVEEGSDDELPTLKEGFANIAHPLHSNQDGRAQGAAAGSRGSIND